MHVLSTPPAFVLSQDQTLQQKLAQKNTLNPTDGTAKPEHIKITDNALIPLKERVVDRKYDPLVWLGNKIFRRSEA